ncbi:MAG: hypothetical protein WAU61_14165 [Smithella sp.]
MRTFQLCIRQLCIRQLRIRSKDNEAARMRLGQAYYQYVEEADDPANKVSQRPEAHPAGEAHNK